MELSFTYTPPEGRKTTTYFSFCYPFSYTDSQKHLFKIEQRVSRMLNTSSPPLSPSLSPSSLSEDLIYYHRDLLCKSLDGLRVDLLTVSSHKGIAMETEPRLFGLFPDESLPTARQFRNKKVRKKIINFMGTQVHVHVHVCNMYILHLYVHVCNMYILHVHVHVYNVYMSFSQESLH